MSSTIGPLHDRQSADAGEQALPATPSVLTELVTHLDDTLDWDSIDPGDATIRLKVFQLLKEALVAVDEALELPAESQAGKVATLLFFATHPEEADYDRLLSWVKDKTPIVRAAAVEALDSVIHETGGGASGTVMLMRAKHALEEQRASETSTVLRYELDQLTTLVGRYVRPARRRVLPPIRTNPYVAGLPIRDSEKFFGRAAIIDRVRRVLQTPGSNTLTIHGARRTGKTSLLYQLRDQSLADDYLPVYIDLQSIAGEPIGRFFDVLASAISKAVARVRPDWPALDEASGLATVATFQAWLREVVEAAPRKLVLLLDEYEVMGTYLREMPVVRQFQSLMDNEPDVFWVFAGAQKVESLKEPGFVILETSKYIRISFLSPETTESLIREPARGILHYTHEAVSRIQRLTGGHPFYTQLLCQTIFDLVPEGATVEPIHVDSAVAQFVHDPSPHVILTWNGLGFPAQIVGASIAALDKDDDWVAPDDLTAYLRVQQYPVRLRLGEIREALSTLREQEWVEKRDGVEEYRLTMGIVGCWVTESRSLWGLLQEHQQNLLRHVAGYGTRMASFAIDVALFSVVVLLGALLSYYLVLTAAPESSDMDPLRLLAIGGVVALAGYTLSFAKQQGTPGMRMLGLLLRTVTGAPITYRRALALTGVFALRAVFWAGILTGPIVALATGSVQYLGVWSLVGIIGFLLEGLHSFSLRKAPERRGLFDKLTGTLVLRHTAP